MVDVAVLVFSKPFLEHFRDYSCVPCENTALPVSEHQETSCIDSMFCQIICEHVSSGRTCKEPMLGCVSIYQSTCVYISLLCNAASHASPEEGQGSTEKQRRSPPVPWDQHHSQHLSDWNLKKTAEMRVHHGHATNADGIRIDTKQWFESHIWIPEPWHTCLLCWLSARWHTIMVVIPRNFNGITTYMATELVSQAYLRGLNNSCFP